MTKCSRCNGSGVEPVEQICDECGLTWVDGISGCPHCGSGNPFRGIDCLTPAAGKFFANDGLTTKEAE